MLSSAEHALRTGESLLHELGIPLAESERLATLPVEQLMAGQARVETDAGWPHFYPIVDGQLITSEPGEALHAGALREIPLLSGSNRDEWNLFAALGVATWGKPFSEEEAMAALTAKLKFASETKLRELLHGYRVSRTRHGLPADNRALLRAIEGDLRFRMPTLRVAETHAELGGSTYAYLFNYGSPALRGALGACHGLELPFVFGSLSAPGQERFAGSGPAVEALSQGMMDAWLAFARTGDPSCEALGVWPPFENRARQTMVFDLVSQVEEAPLEDERRLWAGCLPADLREG
jgi:para-nitrobenzyl esterase